MLKVQSISVSGVVSHIWVICIISTPVEEGDGKTGRARGQGGLDTTGPLNPRTHSSCCSLPRPVQDQTSQYPGMAHKPPAVLEEPLAGGRRVTVLKVWLLVG